MSLQDLPSLTRHIEGACHDFLVPQKRLEAEKVLSSLRHHPDIVHLAFYVLSHSSLPAAHFHTLSGLRESLPFQSVDIIGPLVSQLFDVLKVRFDSVEHFLREILAQIIAICFKLTWDHEKTHGFPFIVSLEGLIANSNDTTCRRLVSTVSASLINEFSSQGTQLGISIEVHRQIQSEFEQAILKKLFMFALSSLSLSLSNSSSSLSQESHALIKSSVHVLEKILSWSTLTASDSHTIAGIVDRKRIENPSSAGDVDADRDFTPRFDESWRDLFFDTNGPDIIGLLFECYMKTFDDAQLASRIGICLSCLAGLNGPIFSTEADKQVYASRYIIHYTRLLQYLHSRTLSGLSLSDVEEKVLSISQMSKLLFQNFGIIRLITSGNNTDAFTNLLDQLHQLTVWALQKLAGSKEDEEEEWNEDVMDELLGMWGSLVHDLTFLSPEDHTQVASRLGQDQFSSLVQRLSTVSTDIFTKFVTTRLFLAEKSGLSQDEEVGDDDEYKDRILFEDQLRHIGSLGRVEPQKSSSSLHTILSELHGQLSTSLNLPTPNEALISVINEKIHWVTMITAHVLADDFDGETPLIPRSLLALSASTQRNVGQDPIVSLVTLLFQILDLVSVDASSPKFIYASPLVIESLLVFVERWGATYLFIDSSLYAQGQLSLSLASAFGGSNSATGSGALSALDFLLDKIEKLFFGWIGEPDVIGQIISTLETFGRFGPLCSALLNSPKFHHVTSIFMANLGKLPSTAHAPLVETITTLVSNTRDTSVRQQHLHSLIQSIMSHFNGLLQNPHFQQLHKSQAIQDQLINSLQVFHGLILSMNDNNRIDVFQAVAAYFSTFVNILELYHNYPDVELYILVMMRDLVKYMDMTLLEEPPLIALRPQLNETITRVFDVFSKNEVGRKRGAGADEEDVYEDVSTLLELLSELIASDYEGLDPQSLIQKRISEEIGAQPQDVSLSTGKVVFYGANKLLPLISDHMLQFPRLSQTYMHLVSLLVEYFPDQMHPSTLPASLLQSLLVSLMYGMKHSLPSVSIESFQAVRGLALYAWYSRTRYPVGVTGERPPVFRHDLAYLDDFLDKLVQTVFEHVLYRPLDSALVDSAAETFFALALARKNTLVQILHSTAEKYTQHQTSHTRLLQAFNTLFSTFNTVEAAWTAFAQQQNIILCFSCGMDLVSLEGRQRKFAVFLKEFYVFLRACRGVVLIK